MKKCSCCKKVKIIEEFCKHKNCKDGFNSKCKVCVSLQRKEYRQNNKEKIVAQRKQFYQNNIEKESARKKKYQQDNKEEIAIKKKKYRKDNSKEIAAYSKEYYQTPEGKKSKRINRHKRRAQKKNVGYEKFDPIEIFERDGWRCQHCHKKVRPDYKNPNHPLYPNLDHIVCLSSGGNHTRQNTQLLCHKCNGIKNNNDSGEQLRLF